MVNRQIVKLTRGVRNNNPLNIRISPARWQGKVDPALRSDKAFEQFTIPGQPYKPGDPQQRVMGYRAALRLLRTYIRTYNRNCIQTIIDRWAPASDGNNPDRYAVTVARLTGINGLKVIRFEEETACKLVAAMAQVESGIPYGQDEELIRAAWRLI